MDGCLVEWGSHASWTCLPNGRVSGRFSDFRHNSRHSNHVSATEVSVSQETGFWVQRQRPPISSEPGTLRLQRLHRRHTARQFGASCTSPGNLRNRRNAWWRTHSGSNLSPRPNSLLNGNLQGIFSICREFDNWTHRKRPLVWCLKTEIPYAKEQGIFRRGSGKLTR